jgi:obscurin-RhoGEF protein
LPKTTIFAEESIGLVRGLETIKTAKIPDTVTFELELSSEGIDVEWFKNDRPIRKDDKYSMVVEGAVHKLIIKDIDGPDAGTYSANFKNRSTQADLIIEGTSNSQLKKIL